MVTYPSEQKLVELNVLVLSAIVVKKADRAEVMSHSKLTGVLDACSDHSGDIYDKAAVLMRELIQKHPFASGNRRTALVATKYFLTQNKAKFKIRNEPLYAKVMQGIRENYYSHEEIKEWIKNGAIRTFER